MKVLRVQRNEVNAHNVTMVLQGRVGCTPLIAAMLEQERIAVRRPFRVAQKVPATSSRPQQSVRTRKEKSS